MYYKNWALIVPLANEANDFKNFIEVVKFVINVIPPGKVYLIVDKVSKDNTKELCEELSGQEAQVSFTPLALLSLIRQLISFFQWGWGIQDRLAFSEVLNSNSTPLQSRNELYEIFQFQETELLSLENYLQEYFEKMLKKLRDLNYDQSQAAKRKDLTF